MVVPLEGSTIANETPRFTFALPENSASLLPVAGLVLVNAKDAGPKDDNGKPIVRYLLSCPEVSGKRTIYF